MGQKDNVFVRFKNLEQFAAKMSQGGSVDLSKYAKLTDIPTSLPANGGTADRSKNATEAEYVRGFRLEQGTFGGRNGLLGVMTGESLVGALVYDYNTHKLCTDVSAYIDDSGWGRIVLPDTISIYSSHVYVAFFYKDTRS